MKRIELFYSSLCFLLALIAAGLLARDMMLWGFIVAWGGSALVAIAYAVTRRRRGASGA